MNDLRNSMNLKKMATINAVNFDEVLETGRNQDGILGESIKVDDNIPNHTMSKMRMLHMRNSKLKRQQTDSSIFDQHLTTEASMNDHRMNTETSINMNEYQTDYQTEFQSNQYDTEATMNQSNTDKGNETEELEVTDVIHDDLLKPETPCKTVQVSTIEELNYEEYNKDGQNKELEATAEFPTIILNLGENKFNDKPQRMANLEDDDLSNNNCESMISALDKSDTEESQDKFKRSDLNYKLTGYLTLIDHIIEANEYGPCKDVLQNRVSYTLTPLPATRLVPFTVERIKGTFQDTFLMYSRNGEMVINAQKVFNLNGSFWQIGVVDDMATRGRGQLGKFRSNQLKSKYILQSKGGSPADNNNRSQMFVREQLAGIKYEKVTNSTLNPNPSTVQLPYVQNKHRVLISPKTSKQELSFNIIDNPKDDRIVLKSNPLTQNQKTGKQFLNFKGKIKMASCKNSQYILQNDNDREVLYQFGKIEKDKQHLSFKYPLSPIQAFSICLSTFDHRQLI